MSRCTREPGTSRSFLWPALNELKRRIAVTVAGFGALAALVCLTAPLVGRERVIAGADCGFAQGALFQRQHPSIMWAKFEALVAGARLATEQLS